MYKRPGHCIHIPRCDTEAEKLNNTKHHLTHIRQAPILWDISKHLRRLFSVFNVCFYNSYALCKFSLMKKNLKTLKNLKWTRPFDKDRKVHVIYSQPLYTPLSYAVRNQMLFYNRRHFLDFTALSCLLCVF